MMSKQRAKGSLGLLSVLAMCGLLAVEAPVAHAVPALQLDIAGGFYDNIDQSIMTNSNTFTVYALLDTTARPGSAPSLTDTYFLSVALEPVTSASANLGSFSVNGTTVIATSDMTYGTPPIERILGGAAADPGDLAPHGVYPTYFREFAFTFNGSNTAGIYNTATTPGGISANLGGVGLLYAAFQLDLTLLNPNYALHFDLYNERVGHCVPGCTSDLDVNYWAPFSHDAGTTTTRGVPEPSAALLLGVGLVGIGVWQRIRAAQSA